MIAHIFGEVADRGTDSVVIDVGGLGYQVRVSEQTLESCILGSRIKLFTHFAVRENGQDLYGFDNLEAKRLFELLITVSGVGPKVAMSIIGLGNPGEIRAAIASGSVAYIVGANGVGKRGAEKIIVELKDKVGAMGTENFLVDGQFGGDDALEGLIALGYSRNQAMQSLSGISTELPVEQRITAALRELSR